MNHARAHFLHIFRFEATASMFPLTVVLLVGRSETENIIVIVSA